MKKSVVWCLFIIACAIGLLSQSVTPKLTEAQKLEIRTAQVEFFQAKTNLEATPVFKQFESAQAKLNQTVQKVLAESKVDQKEFQLGNDLEFTAVPKPPKPAEKK